jgi:hypothetical protein
MLTQCLLCPAVVLQTWPNQNKKEEVERIKNVLLQQLQELRGAPGFAMKERPPDALLPEFAEEDEDQVWLRLLERPSISPRGRTAWC